MSTHPNVILLVALRPDGLTRKTLRDILAESDVDSLDRVKIDSHSYSYHLIMKSEDEVGIMFFDMVTSQYGQTIAWEKLEARKNNLEQWAKQISARHYCAYQISVSAVIGNGINLL